MTKPIAPRLQKLHPHVSIGVFLAILYLAFTLGFVPRSAKLAERIEAFEIEHGSEAAATKQEADEEVADEKEADEKEADEKEADKEEADEEDEVPLACLERPVERSTPDSRLRYTHEELYCWYLAIGDEGRTLYRRTQLSLDLVFPLAYGFLLSILLLFAGAEFFDRRPRFSFLVLLPLLAVGFDLLENVLTVILGTRLPPDPWTDSALLPQLTIAVTRAKFATFAASLVAIGFLGRRRLGELIQRTVFVRVPLLVALVLAVFPVLAASGVPTVENALITESWHDLALAVFLAVLTMIVVGHVLVVIWELAHRRFGVSPMELSLPLAGEDASVGRFFSSVGIGLVLILPLLVQLGVQATSGLFLGFFLGIGGSLLVALLAFVLVLHLRERWAKIRARSVAAAEDDRPGRLTRLADWLPRQLGPGYWNDRESPPRPEAGHLLSIVLSLILLVVYAGFYFGFDPEEAWELPSVLSFVLVLLALVCLLLSGATFFLDRWRFPLFLFVILWAATWNAFVPRSHHFETVGIPKAAAEAGGASAQASEAGPTGPPGPVLTVVASAGGGIQAAAWTARVLTGLQEEIGPAFTDSVALISSTSGGSVGAYYYLAAAAHEGRYGPSEGARECVFRAATTSGLEATAWGLVGPDFRRAVLPWDVKATRDRGWALERSWHQTAQRMRRAIDAGECGEALEDSARPEKELPDFTLAEWRLRAARGELPGVIFNSTFVDDGNLVHLSTVEVSAEEDSRTGLPLEAGERSDCDMARTLRGTTAARLSATFPYVTPVVRSECAADFHGMHLADGGYHDNFGMLGAIRWLTRPASRSLLDRYESVVLVQITSFPEDPDEAPPENPGLLYAWAGPLKTLLAVRTASQKGRNQVEVDLLSEYIGPKFRHVLLRPPLVAGHEAPLSWHLSTDNVDTIETQWERLRDAGALESLRGFY